MKQRVAFLVLGVVALAVMWAARVAWKSVQRIEQGLVATHAPVPPLESLEGLPPGRVVHFATGDGLKLAGWLFPPRNGATVIVGHGHLANRMQVLPQARLLLEHGFGVLLFDWRAHGESEGARVTWGIDERRDVTAALDFLATQPDVDAARVGALGFSMGGLAVVLAAPDEPRLKAVAIEGVYTSLEAQTLKDEARFGWLSQAPALWALRNGGVDLARVRPVDVICRIAPRPVLLVYGTDDLGGPEVAKALAAAACEPKRLVWIDGARHGEYVEVAKVALEATLVGFFEKNL